MTSILMGLVISSSSNILVLLFVGLLLGLALLTQPVLLLWILATVSLIIDGLLQFTLDFTQAQWVSSIVGFMLIIASIIKVATNKQKTITPSLRISYFLAFFIIINVFSSILNLVPVPQAIVGIRTYVPFLGVFFALSVGLISETQIKRMFYFLIIVIFLQVPAIIYQVLVIVPQRAALLGAEDAWDSVNGTFGGTMFGHGASGSLAVYLAVVALLVTVLWQNGFVKKLFFYLFTLSALIVIGATEAKVIFILVPIGFYFLNKDLILRKPVSFLIGSMGVISFLIGVLFAYIELYYSDSMSGDLMKTLQTRFLYSFDPDFMPSVDWPGRLSGIMIWVNNHDFLTNPLTMLIGHGVSAATSTSSLMGFSREVVLYGRGLEVTGLTKLLWESGIIGTVAFIAIMLVCFVQSKRIYINHKIDIWHRAISKAVYASMPILIIAVPYEVTSVSSPPVQFLVMFLLGYINWLSYQPLSRNQ